MLDIWQPLDVHFYAQFCDKHDKLSGERLDASRLKLYKSNLCPYEDYDFIRLEIAPQILSRSSQKNTISASCISYFLLAREEQRSPQIVPLLSASAGSLPIINEILNFQMTIKNVVSYLIVHGLLKGIPPFYFFENVGQIRTFLSKLEPTESSNLLGALKLNFNISDKSPTKIKITTHKHFLLGKSFKLKTPCLHKGHLYVANMHISEHGRIIMETDEQLNIEGLFDEEENYKYYPLDFEPILANEYMKIARSNEVVVDVIKKTMFYEKIASFLFAPLFIFQIMLLSIFGFSDSNIFAYFDTLKGISALNIACLLLGGVMIITSLLRFFFIEVGIYLNKLMPTVWGNSIREIEQHSQSVGKSIGPLLYAVISFAELAVIGMMALCLFFYGLANTFGSFFDLVQMNFGQAILVVMYEIPAVGYFLQSMISLGLYGNISYFVEGAIIVKVMVWFVFYTIVLGLVGRAYSLSIPKD